MMRPMDVLLFLAWRHVVARWRQAILLVTGVAVGVCILTTALSLTNGFEHDLVTKILGTSPHVSLTDPANTGVSAWKDWQSGVSRLAGVDRVWPYVSGQALLVLGNRVSGVMLQGVPRERLREDPLYRQAIVEEPSGKDALGHSGVLVGLELARLRGISRGDSIVLVTGLARRVTLKVSGFFQSGLYELDSHLVLLDLPLASQVMGLGHRVTGLDVRLVDPFQAPVVARAIQQQLPGAVRPWTTQNRPLLGALATEKRVVFLVVLFIIVVATLGAANTLVLWVLEQSRDLAILRAMGASGTMAGRLVLLEGAFITVVGTLVGLVAGFLLSTALGIFPMALPSDIYYISNLPVRMQGLDFVLTGVSAVVLGLLFSILPARRATRLDPIEVIRRA